MKKLLIKFPTRSRPDKFFKTLDCYFSMQNIKNDYLINIDADDKTMNNSTVLNKLKNYTNLTVHIGNSKTKIEACNCGLENVKFEVLLLASDDMIPQIKGFDEIILSHYENESDFALWTYDGTQDRICTLSILDYEYYSRFNYIYNPGYKSFFCDNEFTDIAKHLCKLKIVNDCLIKHEHPIWTGSKKDGLYNKNDKFYYIDKKTYKERLDKNKQYEFKWSIMIPTLVERKEKFDVLFNELHKQIKENNLQNSIEIIVNCDNRKKTVGKKRNELLESVKGEYCNFIDDDDKVSDDYIISMFNLLKENNDCIKLSGLLFQKGQSPKKFIHSIEYKTYSQKGTVYYRPPNHLNIIKSEIAKKYKFKEINRGEDTDWAMRISRSGDLKTESKTESILYFYFYDNAKKI